eukprot:4644648-Heterocapsa_arctica.AAC.1
MLCNYVAMLLPYYCCVIAMLLPCSCHHLAVAWCCSAFDMLLICYALPVLLVATGMPQPGVEPDACPSL